MAPCGLPSLFLLRKAPVLLDSGPTLLQCDLILTTSAATLRPLLCLGLLHPEVCLLSVCCHPKMEAFPDVPKDAGTLQEEKHPMKQPCWVRVEGLAGLLGSC